MTRTRETLAKVLILYLVLLPAVGVRAEARQATDPTLDPPRPFDPPEPPAPPRSPVGGEAVFTPATKPLTISAFNGFSSASTPGFFNHHRHSHGGGVASVDSPWGEQLRIRYWLTPHGMTFEYDDDLTVRFEFDAAGTLGGITAETPERSARMAVGKRVELAYLGQRDFSSFDMSAYQLIEESLRAKHSDAFLAGLRQFDGAAEASCTTDAIQCAACVLLWALSVSAIATACVVGGVVTFGTACITAIIAHEVTNYSCAATCVEMVENCRGRHDAQPIPDGCEP